jgi:hypothetical protein
MFYFLITRDHPSMRLPRGKQGCILKHNGMGSGPPPRWGSVKSVSGFNTVDSHIIPFWTLLPYSKPPIIRMRKKKALI